jgi:CubicO group peptidase (beta-lactamase class C family)
VVQVVSGKSLADYARETIFTPLGMQDTGFHLEDTREIARQYLATETGEIQEMDRTNPFVFTRNYDSGGAGAVGCVDDYIRFADALACGGVGANGYRMLREETVEKIRSIQVQGVSFQNSFTCVKGDEYGYGLGVRVRKKPTSWGLAEGEFGWDGAAGTYLLIDPVKHISVVVAMHLRNWPTIFRGEHLRIAEQVYTEFFGKN